MRRISRLLTPSVALLLSAGCATGGVEGDTGEAGVIRVVVVNDLSPPTALTVRVTSTTSAHRNILGSVSPRSTRTFSFEPRSMQGSFRLVAETATGQEVSSRAFQVSTGDEVEWSVRRNAVDLRHQSSQDD